MLNIRGATRQSWRETGPRDLLKRLVAENPTATEAELLKLFGEAVVDNQSCLSIVIEYWFANNLRALERITAPVGSVVEKEAREVKKAELAKKVAAAKETVASRVSKVTEIHAEAKAKVILLDLMMPTGKPLRDCTGAEVRKLAKSVGGWLAAIAARVKPTQTVGAVLSEGELQRMLAVQHS
jgi:CheY-like chemotaxis protein